MNAALLSQLVEDRGQQRGVVLCTNLDTGEQVLLYPLETSPATGADEADCSEL